VSILQDALKKSDLIQAVLNTENITDAPPTSTPTSTPIPTPIPSAGGEVKLSHKEIGALNCVVVERTGVTPQLVVIMCHGLGANGENLASLGTDFLNRNSQAAVQFVFPDAPTLMDHGGRCWWPLNLQELMTKAMSGQLAQIINSTPPGLETARVCLESTLLDLQGQTKLPWNKFYLGGFSQGAIISVDLLLHLPYDFGGLALFSGALLCAANWMELAKVRTARSTKIIQSHGRQDFILPFILASSLKNFLSQYFTIDWIEFNGGHAIPMEAMDKFNRSILSLL